MGYYSFLATLLEALLISAQHPYKKRFLEALKPVSKPVRVAGEFGRERLWRGPETDPGDQLHDRTATALPFRNKR